MRFPVQKKQEGLRLDASGQPRNDRVRVARIITRMNIGGPAKHAGILARRLTRYDTDLIVGTSSEGEGDLSTADGLHSLIPIPWLQREVAPIKDLRALIELRRYMKKNRPAIVHTHMAKAGTLGRIAARWAGSPVVVHTYHGHVLDGYFRPSVTGIYARIERWLARRSSLLVAVSPEIRDQLLGMGIGDPAKWRVVPLGLELDGLLASRLPWTEARAKLGLPDKPAVGIVGRLAPIKDHRTFIEAARILARRHDVTFVVAGDGALRRELEKEALDLGDSIRFLGWVDDLELLYAALDVVVLTSRNEGTPVALIEAMAAGRPVVATDVGGVRDCVPTFAGTLVAPGDPAAVAEAVSALLGSEFSGSESREWVRQRYGAERLVAEIEGLYDEMLGRAGRSGKERTLA